MLLTRHCARCARCAYLLDDSVREIPRTCVFRAECVATDAREAQEPRNHADVNARRITKSRCDVARMCCQLVLPPSCRRAPHPGSHRVFGVILGMPGWQHILATHSRCLPENVLPHRTQQPHAMPGATGLRCAATAKRARRTCRGARRALPSRNHSATCDRLYRSGALAQSVRAPNS